MATSDTNVEVGAGHGALKPRLPRATRVEEGSLDEPHSHGMNIRFAAKNIGMILTLLT